MEITSGTSRDVSMILARMKQGDVSRKEIYTTALAEFREWKDEENPFKEGSRQRTLYKLLEMYYPLNQTGAQFGKKSLYDHALTECGFIRATILANLCALEDVFPEDRKKDAINSVSAEHLGKEALGGLMAFEPSRG